MNRKPLFRWLLAATIAASVTRGLGAGIVFQDGFESGALGPAWVVRTSNDGRCTVTTNFVPAEGNFHLVLDDSVSDGLYSAASAAFKLDLTHKKNVTLSFRARSLGNEPDYSYSDSSDDFDGVSVSADGGRTWERFHFFDWLGPEWQTFTYYLDWRLPWALESWGDDFLIRFSEYDNAPAPIDGIAIDNIMVTADDYQHGALELPSQLPEGTGPFTGYLLLAYAPTTSVSVVLSTIPGAQLSLPASVEIPAGQTYAAFEFSVWNDNLANLNRTVEILGFATNVTIRPAVIRVLDDDMPKSTLFLPPQLAEGESRREARLVLDKPVSALAEFQLGSIPNGLVYADPNYEPIRIHPGLKEIVFGLRAPENNSLDGNIPITITLTSSQMDPISAETLYIDNERPILSLELPETVGEGMTASARVRLGGDVRTNVTVLLTSSDPQTLTVPRTVITWGDSGEFQIRAPDNALPDGTRRTQLIASAPGFSGTNATVAVSDNEVLRYRVTVAEAVDPADSVPTVVQALDTNGDLIQGGVGGINLFVVLPGGTLLPVTPPSINISTQGWSGEVVLPQVSGGSLRLRAVDANGASGDSNPFTTARVMRLQVTDLAWDSFRNRIYASASSTAQTNANNILVIDPETGKITGMLPLSQDPGQLALTSGGEYLYVILKANGAIARINAATMTLNSTFPVGNDPENGTLYAADICTIAGRPESLVVSRENRNTWPRHAGVAVYDNGVPRPVSTPSGTGSNVIEPSADPTVFFGYNTEQTPGGLRKLRVETSGITETEVKAGFFADIRDIVAEGDIVFAENGMAVDAMAMRSLGAFPTRGPIRPDLANGRAYFLEPDDYYYGSSVRLTAYDLTTFLPIRSLVLPQTQRYTGSFIRWGTNGLAFRTEAGFVLIDAVQLVPSEPTANLRLTMSATPDPVLVSTRLTYTLSLSNQGPAAAKWAHLSVNFSDGQRIQTAQGDAGIASWSNLVLGFDVPELPAGTQATVQVHTIVESAGSLNCTAVASSMAAEEFGDNYGTAAVRALYEAAPDSFNKLRLAANNILYDPGKQVLWATVSQTSGGVPSNSVVSINPRNGLLSDPVPIGAPASCMALSGNGRHLYVGLSNTNEIHRIDVNATPPQSVRIPIGGQAQDVEVLDGDGTSFIIARLPESAAFIFDGEIQRGAGAGAGTIVLLEKTGSPTTFLAYDGWASLRALGVNTEGVAVVDSNRNVLSHDEQLVGSEQLALSSSGRLIDSTTLSLKANLELQGTPCLDTPGHRAYIIYDRRLHGFDTGTFQPTGSLELPLPEYGYATQACVRWGLDGFAITVYEGLIYIVRWSSAIPEQTDSNGDGVSDKWELVNFGSLYVDLGADADSDGICNGAEYCFGTSPQVATTNPLSAKAQAGGAQPVLELVYPRRVGLGPCTYELSQSLTTWTVLEGVVENVLSVETVDGVEREVVQALVPVTNPKTVFIRVGWAP